MLGILDGPVIQECQWRVVCRYAALGREHIQLLDLVQDQIFDDHLRRCFIRQGMIACPDPFLNGPVISFNFRHVILSICRIHSNIQVILERLDQGLKFPVSKDILDFDIRSIVFSEYHVNCIVD